LIHGRYAVVDLSAGPAWYGADNGAAGAVDSSTLARLDLGGRTSLGMITSAMKANIQANLVATVVSGVQHVLAPDLVCQTEETGEDHHHHHEEKIFIPVITFRNHKLFDPVHRDTETSEKFSEYFIDTGKIQEAVNQLALPGQKVELVVEQAQDLSEFVSVSKAIARAIREDTKREPSKNADGRYVMTMRPYLDSEIVRHEFNASLHILDSIAPDLFEDNSELWHFIHPAIPDGGDHEDDPEAHRKLKVQAGTHVFPVYIFSLLGLQRELLIDQKDLVSTGKEGIIVLQTGDDAVSVPYFDQGTHVTVTPRQSTQHVISGLATSFAGLVSPITRVDQPSGRKVDNFLWAVGAHPWGSFSNTTSISAMFTDMVLRNFVVLRLDMAQRLIWTSIERLDNFTQQYLYDPFSKTGDAKDASAENIHFMTAAETQEESPFPVETVSSLSKELETMQTRLEQVGGELGNLDDLAEAYEFSNDVLSDARSFEKRALGVLQEAELDLACCDVEHKVSQAIDKWALLYVISAVFVVYVLVLRWAQTGTRNGRKQ